MKGRQRNFDGRTINTCLECGTDKKKCPYPAAFNSKIDGHQACDEAFANKYTRREEKK